MASFNCTLILPCEARCQDHDRAIETVKLTTTDDDGAIFRMNHSLYKGINIDEVEANLWQPGGISRGALKPGAASEPSGVLLRGKSNIEQHQAAGRAIGSAVSKARYRKICHQEISY